MSSLTTSPALPPGFLLGTLAAAFQVEGGAADDGRGPSTWDAFAARGRLAGAVTGEVASDHYHRHADDVALLEQLGVGAHRFSVSWSRVQPTGSGPVNPAGLDFYDRLVDELVEAGVRPVVTLFHWDLPQALEDDGGWFNRATVERFAEYAGVVGERLGDRVASWVPVHEPSVLTYLGHGLGEHAPGRRMVLDALPVAHHLLLAHGRAAVALRATGATSVGCANHHAPMWPASDDEADTGATKLFDAIWNGLFLEPMLLGRYPVDLAPIIEPWQRDGDLATIRQPLDFYGVDYSGPLRVGAAPEGEEVPFATDDVLGFPTTGQGRAIVPDALREWLIVLRARFRAALPPIVVTGCGGGWPEEPGPDGVVDDQARIDYLDAHLAAVAEACQRGVDVRGFFARTLLDGLEWTDGWGQRTGLVHVDPTTLVRTPKRSFAWYADVVRSQSRSLG